jgi:hypothetical protein
MGSDCDDDLLGRKSTNRRCWYIHGAASTDENGDKHHSDDIDEREELHRDELFMTCLEGVEVTRREAVVVVAKWWMGIGKWMQKDTTGRVFILAVRELMVVEGSTNLP